MQVTGSPNIIKTLYCEMEMLLPHVIVNNIPITRCFVYWGIRHSMKLNLKFIDPTSIFKKI